MSVFLLSAFFVSGFLVSALAVEDCFLPSCFLSAEVFVEVEDCLDEGFALWLSRFGVASRLGSFRLLSVARVVSVGAACCWRVRLESVSCCLSSAVGVTCTGTTSTFSEALARATVSGVVERCGSLADTCEGKLAGRLRADLSCERRS